MIARKTQANDGDLFAALPEVDEAAQRRLHARLVAAATEAGILDVAYRTIDTPVGTLLLAATEKGLVRVAYAREDHAMVLDQLANSVSPRVLRAPARLDMAAMDTSPADAACSTSSWTSSSRRAFVAPSCPT